MIILLFIPFLSFGQCPSPNLQHRVVANGISYSLTNSGFIWRTYGDSLVAYILDVPENIGTMYDGAIWMTGRKSNGAVIGSIPQYQNGFFSGPIDEQTGLAYDCWNLDNIWQVSRPEIINFVQNGILSQNIIDWPGRNNPNNQYLPDQEMAPFVDVDGDGNYNPQNGDYPLIKGDHCTWQVFNDKGGIMNASSQGRLGMEFQLMTYSYTTNNSVMNSVFYDLVVINRSNISYHDMRFGLNINGKIGCPNAEIAGIDSLSQSMYWYNSQHDGTGNSFISVEDAKIVQVYSFNEAPMVNEVIAPFSSGMIIHQNTMWPYIFPQNSYEYHHLLSAKWVDGAPLTYGGLGYNTGPSTNMMFTGDPCDTTDWNMHSAGIPNRWYSGVLAYGPFSMESGDRMHTCFTTHYRRSPASTSFCGAVAPGIYSVQMLPSECDQALGIDVSEKVNLEYYVQGKELFFHGLFEPIEYDLFNIQGQLVRSGQTMNSVSLSDQSAGIYILKVTYQNQLVSLKFSVSE